MYTTHLQHMQLQLAFHQSRIEDHARSVAFQAVVTDKLDLVLSRMSPPQSDGQRTTSSLEAPATADSSAAEEQRQSQTSPSEASVLDHTAASAGALSVVPIPPRPSPPASNSISLHTVKVNTEALTDASAPLAQKIAEDVQEEGDRTIERAQDIHVVAEGDTSLIIGGLSAKR